MNRPWGLQRKVVLTIVGVGLLPLAAGLLWTGLYGRSALVNASGEKFTELAKLLSSHVDFLIDREIHEAQSLALAEEVRTALAAANALPPRPEQTAEPDPALLATAASRYLLAYQTLKEDEYDKIIVIDRHGQPVASTRPLPRQSFLHEAWWPVVAEGQSAIDIRELPGEGDGRQLRIAFALPILDQQSRQTIGVIRLLIKELGLDQVLREVNTGTTGHAMLVQADGRVLLCTLRPAAAHQPIGLLPGWNRAAGWAKGENGHNTGSTVLALSSVLRSANFSPDASPSLWVAVTQDRTELFAPINRAFRVMSWLSVILTGALLLLGATAGRRLVRPILALRRGAEELGSGNLSHRLHVATGDELEELANAINRMAEHLEQSAESRLKAERLTALHRLSTVLTHDLRSPMVGMLKALALLQEMHGQMPDFRVPQLLADLIRGGDLLLGTLNDLLDVYRHSLSALPLRRTEFVLDQAIDEIVRLLSVDADTRGIKLQVIIAPQGLVLFADRRRIQRVIFNLVDNALKHSPSGGLVTLHVNPRADDWIELQVKDQGAGIRKEDRARIFDFLAESTPAQNDRMECSGVGVGLYFCRMTVEAHGGWIRGGNNPEGGARFIVALPAHTIEDGADDAE